MARRYIDTKDAIGYCEDKAAEFYPQSVFVERHKSGMVRIVVSQAACPPLTLKQAKCIADKIQGWCAEGKK